MRRLLVWVEISEFLREFMFCDHILATFLLDKIWYLKKNVLSIVVFYFPRSILATSFWIPSERTLIMWFSFVKAKRSPPITWGISWVTWLKVRVAFSLTLAKKRIIFYCTNLVTQLITGSRRSYRGFFGQYQAFIWQKGRRENTPSEIGCAWCQGGVGGFFRISFHGRDLCILLSWSLIQASDF